MGIDGGGRGAHLVVYISLLERCMVAGLTHRGAVMGMLVLPHRACQKFLGTGYRNWHMIACHCFDADDACLLKEHATPAACALVRHGGAVLFQSSLVGWAAWQWTLPP